MANPGPPPWGPMMEQELRDRLTADGFHVTRCECLETHPVVALRLRGPVELTDREVRRRIRRLANDLGHRAPAGGMAITGRAGKFDGAFVMQAEFGAAWPRSEILP